MDWSKAKNILIIALLLTNLALGGFYFAKRSDADRSAERAAEYAAEYAQAEGLRLECELPAEAPKLPVLFVSVYYEEPDAAVHSYKGIPVEADTQLDVELIPNQPGETAGSVISAADALLKLIQEHGEELRDPAAAIRSVELVYLIDEFDLNERTLEDTAVPAWKFSAGGRSFFIKAYGN